MTRPGDSRKGGQHSALGTRHSAFTAPRRPLPPTPYPLLPTALLLLLLLLLASSAAAQPAPPRAALIDLHRLLYDPEFPPSGVQGWLAKRGAPLASMQERPGDASSLPGVLLGTAAAREGVNPRVLLTWLELRGGLSGERASFGLSGESFAAQVDRAAKILREGLLPAEMAQPIRMADGVIVNAEAYRDPGSYALMRAFATAMDHQEWSRLNGTGPESFVATYRRLFGQDPREPMPLAPDSPPFLTPPFFAPFEHRSYFDHTYPTVDYGSDANPAMTSYDGVLGRFYDRHDGHDYEFPTGTPVYAAAAGTAFFLRSNDCGDPNTYGILIRHANNYETIYWHLSSMAGPPGSSRALERGEWLGNSGQSGCANRPHLHFELRHNGLASDPYGWRGPGADPCPALVGGPGRYPGCEASVYLWQTAPDGPPPAGTPLPISTRTLVPSNTPRPVATVTPGCGGGGTYPCPDVPKRIPAEGTMGTTTSRLTIVGGPTISSIRVVGLSLEHTYAADLDVFLISPAGTRVELFSDACPNQAWNAGTTGFSLDSAAATVAGVVCPPGNAAYRPEGSLAPLLGQPSSGTWILEVIDDSSYDAGSLYGWGLEINGAGCPGGPPTATPQGACGISFRDVQPADYFYEPVRYLLCRGIVSGYADGTFRPYSQVTRAQLLKMVAHGEGWNLQAPARASFSDVQPSDWFYPYVETAVQQGVVAGYEDGTFRPNHSVNRGQVAKIVVLAAGWFLAAPPRPTFSDVPAGSPYFPYVETAALRRIMSGYGDGTFRPFELSVRAQVAKTLHTRLGGE